MSRLSRIFPLILLVVAGCTPEPEPEIPEEFADLENLTVFPAEPQSSGEITLTREVSYGDTGEVVLGQYLSGMEVDEEGNVYIADGQASQIHVYNPDGSFRQSAGRMGRGPGEFTGLVHIEVSENRLLGLGYQTNKISVFELPSLEHLNDYGLAIEANDNKPSWLQRTRDNGTAYRPQEVYLRPDGNYLVLFYDESVIVESNLYNRSHELSIYDPAERDYAEHGLLSFPWSAEVIFHQRENGISALHDVPYKRNSKHSYQNGTLVQGWNDDMLFKFYDADGTYRKAWYFPVPENPLTLEQALELFPSDQASEMVKEDELPGTWPAFNSLLLDDENRLWVSRITGESPDMLEWWVLSDTGDLLAEFSWSRNETFEEIRNGKLYAMVHDTATYTLSAVRYDIGW